MLLRFSGKIRSSTVTNKSSEDCPSRSLSTSRKTNGFFVTLDVTMRWLTISLIPCKDLADNLESELKSLSGLS